MTLSWDVLSTLTPTDYTSFRDVLGTSSGFQSAQFRQVEFLLGIKDQAHLRYQEDGSAGHAALQAALHEPSLWDEHNAALARAGRDLPAHILERDWSVSYETRPAVEEASSEVTRATSRRLPLYTIPQTM